MATTAMESLFSHPRRNGRQVNLGNTVLVNTGELSQRTDQWCLGYIQDIAGDQVLVDLVSAQFPPRWISAQFIWYHRFVEFNMYDQLCPPPMKVQVALRTEKDGPYVFRPGKLLTRPSLANLYLCCVTISTDETGSDNSQHNHVLHVHHWQVVESLPTNEPSLFGRLNKTAGSLDEIPVLKFVVHSKKGNTVKVVDENVINRVVGRAIRHAGFDFSYGNRHCLHRMFISLGKDSIAFLLFDCFRWRAASPGDPRQRHWTTRSGQKFSAKIEEELNELQGETQGTGVQSTYTSEESESSIPMLPWELMSDILRFLDFHSQMKVKRVCAAWHSLLNVTSADIVIDFVSIGKRHTITPSEGYYLGVLINQAVTQKTKTLTLVHHHARYYSGEPCWAMKDIRDTLLVKGVKLLSIRLKDSQLLEYEMIRHYRTSADFHYKGHTMRQIPILLPVCRRLLLSNIMVDSLVCQCHTDYLDTYSTLPGHLYVTLPYLEFDGSSSASDTMRRYGEAVQSHLPALDEIEARFKECHHSFVETLPYPDGWQRFRQFLRRHNFTELSQSDSYWNALDLRNFDQLPLGKAALLLIDVCLNLAFETDPP